MLSFPNMFSPYKIKNVKFPNRVFASPVTANMLAENGHPTREGIDSYEIRARGGFAVVTVSETFIDGEFSSRHNHCIDIWKKDMSSIHMESIMTLTEAIRAHGAVASIQLNHTGAMNHPNAIPGHRNPIGPSSFLREDGVQVDEMTIEQIEKTAETWAKAALNCKRLGFQMVNIHGAHGWLLNQFISPRFNKRTDEFGGSMENRAKFPIMVCEKIREYCGDDFLIEYRMSGSERIEGGMTLNDGIEFAEIIQKHVDLIHVTSGTYLDHINTKAFSSMYDPHGCNLDLSAAIKAHVHIPVVAVGGFNAPEQIEQALAEEKCDFAALGRQQFADPNFVRKARYGHADQIMPCLRCSCFNPLPSDPEERTVMKPMFCTVNPINGRELRWRSAPKSEKQQRVLVIGGGPAGMYAAITAARRGHKVILAERKMELGGLLWFTKYDKHKESLLRFRNALIAQINNTMIDVRLNYEITPETVDVIAPDAMICAIGSIPLIPQIPGIEHARYATDAYLKLNDLKNKKVVIIGGGAIGCETGFFLAEHCCVNVELLEAGEALCRDSEPSQRIALLPRMKNAGITSNIRVSIQEITPKGVYYTDSSNNLQFSPADYIYYCCGRQARLEEAAEFNSCNNWFVIVGDAKQARTVREATYEGFAAAMDIV